MLLCPLTVLLDSELLRYLFSVTQKTMLERERERHTHTHTSRAENSQGAGETEGCRRDQGKRRELIYTPQGFQTRTGPSVKSGLMSLL